MVVDSIQNLAQQAKEVSAQSNKTMAADKLDNLHNYLKS